MTKEEILIEKLGRLEAKREKLMNKYFMLNMWHLRI